MAFGARGAFRGSQEPAARLPPERRNRTVRRIAVFFAPYKTQVGIVTGAILLTSLLGIVNPLSSSG